MKRTKYVWVYYDNNLTTVIKLRKVLLKPRKAESIF